MAPLPPQTRRPTSPQPHGAISPYGVCPVLKQMQISESPLPHDFFLPGIEKSLSERALYDLFTLKCGVIYEMNMESRCDVVDHQPS